MNTIKGVYLTKHSSFQNYKSNHEDSFIEKFPRAEVFVEHTRFGDEVHVVVDDADFEESHEIINHKYKE